MSLLSLAICGALIGLVLIQSALVIQFVHALRRPAPPLLADDRCPHMAVILCLRGTDPFLADCLRGLFRQQYPRFDVCIVVDHADDDAHAVVARVQGEERSAAIVQNLVDPRPTCSLKCSSLLQAISSLDSHVAAIALVDADTVAHPTWLRELATALEPEDVGAATGNRWYMPRVPSVGALVRYTWNAAAVVQMYWYAVAWGGSLAIKSRVLRECDVLSQWGRAFCEDTMLKGLLRPMGLRIAFAPSLMMINRENCTLGGFLSWVSRQLLCARLYHPDWLLVALHGISVTVVPLSAAALFVVGLARSQTPVVVAAGVSLGVYVISLFASLIAMEAAVRRIAQNRDEESDWLGWGGMVKCAAIMPITQLIHPLALAIGSFARRTTWRRIRYRIRGPWQVRMVEYRPFQDGGAAVREASL